MCRHLKYDGLHSAGCAGAGAEGRVLWDGGGTRLGADGRVLRRAGQPLLADAVPDWSDAALASTARIPGGAGLRHWADEYGAERRWTRQGFESNRLRAGSLPREDAKVRAALHRLQREESGGGFLWEQHGGAALRLAGRRVRRGGGVRAAIDFRRGAGLLGRGAVAGAGGVDKKKCLGVSAGSSLKVAQAH